MASGTNQHHEDGAYNPQLKVRAPGSDRSAQSRGDSCWVRGELTWSLTSIPLC